MGKESTVAWDAEYVEVDEAGTEFRYRIGEDGCARIVRCRACAECVNIPEYINGCPVVGLEASSFSNLAKVQKIVCPRHLRHIGCRAFESCMDLCCIEFNDTLESIDSEAFFLCRSLDAIDLPCSLRRMGVNLAGAQGARFDFRAIDVHIAPDSPYLFVDAQNVVYERTEDGLVAVDGSRFSGTELVLLAGTVAVGARAFAQNAKVQTVLLPAGCRRIEREAFRGCTALVRIELPDSLEEIQEAAFSCTALRELNLPRNCTRLHDNALVLGPVVANLDVRPFSCALARVAVHPENPVYRMCGPVLCKRVGKDAQGRELLQAVLCSNKVDDVHLPSTVTSVNPAAFAGTSFIGHLHVSELLACAAGSSLFPHHACSRLTVDFASARDGQTSLTLEMPEGGACNKVMEAGFAQGRVDVKALLAAYDEQLPHVVDRLAQARQMVARLAAPLYLSEASCVAFERQIAGSFDAVCVSFGARSYWQGFEQLADAGLLDERAIARAITLLTQCNDAPASGYLLALKQRRFGKATWDYDL